MREEWRALNNLLRVLDSLVRLGERVERSRKERDSEFPGSELVGREKPQVSHGREVIELQEVDGVWQENVTDGKADDISKAS